MYRAAAAVIIDSRAAGRRGAVVEHRPADIHFDWAADPPAIIADGRPMDRRIREADVTAIVSPVSAIRALRSTWWRQRLIGRRHPRLVSEGRDQGSVVFPTRT